MKTHIYNPQTGRTLCCSKNVGYETADCERCGVRLEAIVEAAENLLCGLQNLEDFLRRHQPQTWASVRPLMRVLSITGADLDERSVKRGRAC